MIPAVDVDQARALLTAFGKRGPIVVGELHPPTAAVEELAHTIGVDASELVDVLLGLLELGHVELRIRRVDGTWTVLLTMVSTH